MARSRAPSASRGVFGEEAKAKGGVPPNLLHIGSNRLHPQVLEVVQAPGSFLLVGNQPSLVQQPKVPRDRGAADRERIGDLLDRAGTLSQHFDDRTAVGIAEGVEGIAGAGGGCHQLIVTAWLP